MIPHFTDIENWVNPVIGVGMGLDRDKFGRLMDEYYMLRGWDPSDGRPTAAKLAELGLEDVARELVRMERIPAEPAHDAVAVR